MENMFLMLYPVLKSLGANGGWWGGMEMSPNMGEIPKMRKICTQQNQYWGCWGQKVICGVEWKGRPKWEKSQRWEKICTQWNQNWGYLWPTEYTEFIENMLLMLYPVLGSLGAKSGPWGAEMQWKFPPM